MFNRLIGNKQDGQETQSQNIIELIIPLILLIGGRRIDNLSISFNKDYSNSINMIENIKPYFTENEQPILSKVQDIFYVLEKVKKIKNNSYNGTITEMTDELSGPEKKVALLSEMSKFMDGKNKNIIDNVIQTKNNIDKTKSNLDEYKVKATQEDTGKIDSMLKLMNSFEPILKDENKKKVKKIEKIIEIMKMTDEEL